MARLATQVPRTYGFDQWRGGFEDMGENRSLDPWRTPRPVDDYVVSKRSGEDDSSISNPMLLPGYNFAPGEASNLSGVNFNGFRSESERFGYGRAANRQRSNATPMTHALSSLRVSTKTHRRIPSSISPIDEDPTEKAEHAVRDARAHYLREQAMGVGELGELPDDYEQVTFEETTPPVTTTPKAQGQPSRGLRTVLMARRIPGKTGIQKSSGTTPRMFVTHTISQDATGDNKNRVLARFGTKRRTMLRRSHGPVPLHSRKLLSSNVDTAARQPRVLDDLQVKQIYPRRLAVLERQGLETLGFVPPR